jgi:hypothetical protein
MNRHGQVLIEALLAGILLASVIPHIGPICWKYAGPDWHSYYAMVAANNALIALNEQKARLACLQGELATIEIAKRKQDRAEHNAYAHEQAMDLLNNFTIGESNVWADCLINANGKQITQAQKDELIRLIHRSAGSGTLTPCRDMKLPASLSLFATRH